MPRTTLISDVASTPKRTMWISRSTIDTSISQHTNIMQVINQRQEQSFERRNSLVSVNVCTRAGSCQVCYPTSTKRKIIIFALNKLERDRNRYATNGDGKNMEISEKTGLYRSS